MASTIKRAILICFAVLKRMYPSTGSFWQQRRRGCGLSSPACVGCLSSALISTENGWDDMCGETGSHRICFSRNEDKLATGGCCLPFPGLGSVGKRHLFSFDGAASGSGVGEDFTEGLRFLLGSQRIVGIADDVVQATAHNGRLKACCGSGSRANIDQPAFVSQHATGCFRRNAPYRINDQLQGAIAGGRDALADLIHIFTSEINDSICALREGAGARRLVA